MAGFVPVTPGRSNQVQDHGAGDAERRVEVLISTRPGTTRMPGTRPGMTRIAPGKRPFLARTFPD
jgi:hypothetical protein